MFIIALIMINFHCGWLLICNLNQYAVPENIHIPPDRRDWNFLGVRGGGVL